MPSSPPDPHAAGLTIGLALMFGMLAQVAARRLRVPGIVILLLAGVALGPDGLNLVRPHTLGAALHTVIGFAVAVILFEGSLSLEFRKLRRQARVIQLLVTVGALISAAGAILAARFVMDWPWRQAVLFGPLVMVTGPTVIQPLLQRLHLVHRPHTVLEAEGIFVDAVGALVAVVTLELMLAPHGNVLTAGLEGLGVRVLTGLALGVASGLVVAWGLKRPSRVPEPLGNVFTLAVTLGAFQVSNAIAPDSGVIAVITLGLWVGNSGVKVKREILSFKEQLTVLLIGLLFVLLAADVRLATIGALGWRGVLTVACLMFVVRPLAVFASTYRSDLTFRERLFVSWLGPRGIVAAAVASLFAARLTAQGDPAQGEALRALVFLVIALTVGVQGLSSVWVAQGLGVRRARQGGFVILGADGLARLLARALNDRGEPSTLIELRADATREAEDAGLKVLFGNGLDERTLLRTDPQGRRGFVGLTPNEAVNVLFVERVLRHVGAEDVWAALHRGHVGVGAADVQAVGGRVLFGDEQALDVWSARANRDEVSLRTMRLTRPQVESALPSAAAASARELLLPLLHIHGERVELVDDQTSLKSGDVVVFALNETERTAADEWLAAHGWSVAEPRVDTDRVAPSVPAEPTPA